MFWTMVGRSFWTELKASRIAAGAFLVTCGVELSQLHSSEWIDAIRLTRAGGMLLGRSFDVLDFPHYGLGGLLGCGMIRFLDRGRSDRGT